MRNRRQSGGGWKRCNSRHWRHARWHALGPMFALVVALNLVAVAWHFSAIDQLDQNSALSRLISAQVEHVRTVDQREQQRLNEDRPGDIEHAGADNNVDNGNGFHVLVLISSIPRANETICTTINGVLQNYQADESATKQNTPHVLIHRYGDWKCEDNSTLTSSQVTLRQYPPHDRASLYQQTNDYLRLMKDGEDMVAEELGSESPFSHVMFLDDDVELCPGFESILVKARNTFPSFGMGHLGRGGSGIIVPAESLPKLRLNMMSNHNSKKPVDKSMLEWARHLMRVCTIRPVTIQMRHIGLQSAFKKNEKWQDTDRCGAPANNVIWQGMSESASSDFFGEYCLNDPRCSPYSSGPKGNCTTCINGYKGKDCGIPENVHNYKRRDNIASIVAFLSVTGTEEVLADSKKHTLINLYVIGNLKETGWLAPNVYATIGDAGTAFKEDLKDTARWGHFAFAAETIYVHNLLSPEKLWTMKYYQEVE